MVSSQVAARLPRPAPRTMTWPLGDRPGDRRPVPSLRRLALPRGTLGLQHFLILAHRLGQRLLLLVIWPRRSGSRKVRAAARWLTCARGCTANALFEELLRLLGNPCRRKRPGQAQAKGSAASGLVSPLPSCLRCPPSSARWRWGCWPGPIAGCSIERRAAIARGFDRVGAAGCSRTLAALRCPFLIEQISEPGLLAAHAALLQQTTQQRLGTRSHHGIAIAHQQAQHQHTRASSPAPATSRSRAEIGGRFSLQPCGARAAQDRQQPARAAARQGRQSPWDSIAADRPLNC